MDWYYVIMQEIILVNWFFFYLPASFKFITITKRYNRVDTISSESLTSSSQPELVVAVSKYKSYYVLIVFHHAVKIIKQNSNKTS